MEENKKWQYRLKVIGFFILFLALYVVVFHTGYSLGVGLMDQRIKYMNNELKNLNENI